MRTSLLVLLLLLLIACGKEDPPAETESARRSPAADSALLGDRVRTGPIQERNISYAVECTGRIEIPPTDFTSVHSRLEGQVSGLRYLPGDYVKRGTQLLRISNPQLIERQRELLEKQAQLATARRALDRQNILAGGDATTAAALDDSRGQVALLEASVNGIESELRQYGIDLERLVKEGKFQSSVGVYAEASGYIHSVTTNQGSMVVPGDELMEIAGTGHVHLELMIPSRDIAYLKKGQEVTFNLPFHGAGGRAEVEKINPMVHAETATLQIHCHIKEEAPEGMVPGLFVTATINVGERPVRGLPRSGTIKEGQEYYGFRKEGDRFVRTLLPDASEADGFVAFSAPGAGEWVTEGAYYVE